MRYVSLLIGLISILLGGSFAEYNRAPAGTQAVPGLYKTYLDQTEVTNKRWREYLKVIAKKSSKESSEFQNALPDPAIWEQAYKGQFLESTQYDDHPVVGIDYQQAIAYCQWRSEYVSEKENRKIHYSLPSMKVYELTQRGKNENKVAEGLYSTSLGFRTFLGLCDNAAEMTEKEGVAIKGSNRQHCLETYEYVVPSPSLGFRCMAELK